MDLNSYLFIVCSATYATLALLIAIQSRNRSNLALSACCGVTALWSASSVIPQLPPMEGTLGFIDLLRLTSWYLYLLLLYKIADVGARWHIYGFGLIAAFTLLLGSIYIAVTAGTQPYSVYSPPVALRLIICVFELLLIENLYLNLPENARWHIAIPCVLLGGLACFDILVSADTVVFHTASTPFTSARVVAMIIVAPLLVLAASRGQRWREPIRLSRTAVFHSATLVLSGSVLLALALAGEVLRRFDDTLGWIAELSLIFAGVIGMLLFLSSRSARSIMQRVLVRHFFADRYDYRLQWLECIGTLSGTGTIERTSLPHRAIRAVADIVNSPSGALFLLEQGSGAMFWAGSWNMPSTTSLSASHGLVRSLSTNGQVIEMTPSEAPLNNQDAIHRLGSVWLAIPLVHSEGTIGMVVVGPPRVAFRLDQEVFDLLRILGREVATYIAEQRATEVILQTRNLHDYGKRFAFVAHDIKNVSSQLALLLSNAQIHIENPDFQHDMLQTVRASVEKIDGLLKRLDEPETRQSPMAITPLPRLEALVATYQRVRKVTVVVVHDGSTGTIAISPDAFDTAVTHLLNNAVEAAPGQPVHLRLAHEASRVLIDIIDHGAGMSANFIRDDLFAPFKTRKEGGSGIGAFQARELIKEAGGQLLVTSEQGVGTTMRLVFTRADQAPFPSKGRALENAVGD